MKFIDWDAVKESNGSGFDRPPVGGYVITIVGAVEDEAKEYYRLSYDYAEGEWKDYWLAIHQAHGWNLPFFICSYKESARDFFKDFMIDLQESNPRFDWHAWVKAGAKPDALIGLKLGVVVGEEENQWPVGEGPVKIRQAIRYTLPVADIRAGKFKVPALKKLKGSSSTPAPAAGNAATTAPVETGVEECPF